MIDWLSLEIIGDNARNILNNKEIPFQTRSDKETGELLGYSAAYKHLRFNYKEPTEKRQYPILNIKGSLHTFYKNENYSDFPLSEIKQAISSLIALGVDAQAQIKCLEFGVNIETPIPPKQIFENYLQYDGKPFLPMPNKVGIMLELDEYKVKIYDKRNQWRKFRYKNKLIAEYSGVENLMRIEIRVKKRRFLDRKGIKCLYLTDLQDESFLKEMSKVLLSVYDTILKVELLEIERMTASEKEKLRSWRCGEYWQRMKLDNMNTYKSKLKAFKNLQIKYKGENSVHDVVGDRIEKRLTELMNDNLIYAKRFCITTKQDITDQRKGSKFISAKYHGEQQAKKARNDHSNTPNNLRKRVLRALGQLTPQQLGLFDSLPQIQLTAKEIDILEYFRGKGEYDILTQLGL